MRWVFVCLFVFKSSLVQGLVLENLIENKSLESTFSHKKIGYYVGSFDPLHLGHQDVAQLPVEKGLVDYVLVVPSWGGDTYKKRIPVTYRLDMLFSAFEHHPHVIVTRLSPFEMQQALMVLKNTQLVFEKSTVKPAFPGTQFIGIVGSDTAYYLSPNPEALETFMTGIEIPQQYKEHTLGGLMAIPVDSFILARREGDDIANLKGKIGERPIIATIESASQKDTSSTKIKKSLQSGKSIENAVGPKVANLIEKHKLYLPSQ